VGADDGSSANDTPVDKLKVRVKILAIKWRRLGDTILWTSALAALRQHFPSAEIHLAFPANYAELFAADTRWQAKYPLSTDRSLKWVPQWRREQYDLALNFHASSRTVWLTRLSGAKEIAIHHHRRRPKRFLFQRSIPNLGKPMGANERDLNLVRAFGWSGEAPETGIAVSNEQREAGKKILEQQGWREGERLLLIHPGASRPAKMWPRENFAALNRALRAGGEAKVIWIHDGVGTLDPSMPVFGEPVKWIVTPRLRDLVGALGWASLYLGSDSGVKHLACALGVRTLTLFGPESLGEWHFYDRVRHPVLQRPVGCRNHDPVPPEFAWCGVERCPLGSHACLTQISPEEVLTEIRRLI